MKKFLSFFLLMIMIVIILPLLIVKGCNSKKTEYPNGQDDIVKIKVYINSEKKIEEMLLEDYIKGVIAAEMPVEFELEALKAQAVAARTYAYSRKNKLYLPNENPHPDADICTDSAHCQAWISKADIIKKWGLLSSYKNWNKIERAVNETKGIIIIYNNIITNPLFHSNSGGMTENAKDVFGCDVPYLRSVKSDGEDQASGFRVTVFIKNKDFIDRLKNEYPKFKVNEEELIKNIKVVDYTEGQRVKDIKIGNIVLKGTEFRSIFCLRSANFKIEKEDKDTLKVTTQGYGHGVGMSQWGANYLAKNGGSYEEILKYYYKGVNLETINDYEAKNSK